MLTHSLASELKHEYIALLKNTYQEKYQDTPPDMSLNKNIFDFCHSFALNVIENFSNKRKFKETIGLEIQFILDENIISDPSIGIPQDRQNILNRAFLFDAIIASIELSPFDYFEVFFKKIESITLSERAQSWEAI
jgi:hypothetical protein